jgi:hypothetical protein
MVIIYPQMGVASANYVNYSPKMDILQFAQLQSHKGMNLKFRPYHRIGPDTKPI